MPRPTYNPRLGPNKRKEKAQKQNQKKKAFRFLDLPRELRDIVYDHLLQPFTFTTKQKFKCSATGIAKRNYLVVNHQFGKEIQEASDRRSALTISDAEDVETEDAMNCVKGLPAPSFKVRSLHLNIRHDFQGHPGSIGFRKHITWIESVVKRMADLKELSVKSVLEEHSYNYKPENFARVWRRSTCSAGKKRSCKLEIYQRDANYGEFEFENQKELLFRWSVEKRCLEKFEKVVKVEEAEEEAQGKSD